MSWSSTVFSAWIHCRHWTSTFSLEKRSLVSAFRYFSFLGLFEDKSQQVVAVVCCRNSIKCSVQRHMVSRNSMFECLLLVHYCNLFVELGSKRISFIRAQYLQGVELYLEISSTALMTFILFKHWFYKCMKVRWLGISFPTVYSCFSLQMLPLLYCPWCKETWASVRLFNSIFIAWRGHINFPSPPPAL